MKWFRDIFRSTRTEPDAALKLVQERFVEFVALLERNNQVVKLIGNLDEALQADAQLGPADVRANLDPIRSGLRQAVQNIIALGGDEYTPLMDRYASVDEELCQRLQGKGPVDANEPTIPANASSATASSAELTESDAEHDTQDSLVRQFVTRITPLALMDPSDADFVPENCQTFRDIARYAHQKAMQEMFTAGHEMSSEGRIGVRLRSDIPLPVDILYIDQDPADYQAKQWIEVDQIESRPMRAFWEGLLQEGWPSQTQRASVAGFMSVLATTMSTPQAADFAERSFALLSKEYMIVSLHMGYHVTMVEAMCSPSPSMNYVRMQFSRGGAPLDRRVRRVRLIANILDKAGFVSLAKADFLDAMITHLDADRVAEKLYMLGRLGIMTKQLDMALSNDGLAQWYTEDFIARLGLDQANDPSGQDEAAP